MCDPTPSKQVLYIENDKRMSKLLLEHFGDAQPFKDKGWNVEITVARHMQHARELLLGKNAVQFDGLIVDIMLPPDKNVLDKLEPLEETREKLLKELISRTEYDSLRLDNETVALRLRIRKFDEEIEGCLELMGGYDILAEYARKQDGKVTEELPKSLRIPVVFCTARGLPEVVAACRSIVVEDYYAWLEKPVESAVVASKLRKLLDHATLIEEGVAHHSNE